MKNKINYMVISLLDSEVQEELRRLSTAEGHDLWHTCLDTCKSNYGSKPEHWKPFGTQTIKELVDSCEAENVIFNSQSNILKQHMSPGHIVREFLESNIRVIFVDPYSLFLEENKELIIRIMSRVAKGDQCICCIVSSNLHMRAITDKCYEVLENFQFYYRKGIRHKKISSEEDFSNFINDTESIPLLTMQPSKENQDLFSDLKRNILQLNPGK